MNWFSSIVKYILGFFNLLLCAAGIAVIVVGVFIFQFFVDLFNNTDLPDLDLSFIGILVIVLGCVLTLVAFFGCCGAFVENRCLLYLYLVIVALMMVPKIIFVIFWNTQLNRLINWLDTLLTNTFNDYPEIFFGVEFTLNCCGTTGPQSYANANHTIVPVGYLPATCCPDPFTPNNVVIGAAEGSQYCLTSDYDGCNAVVTDFVDSYGSILSSVFIGIITVEALAIALSIYVCCAITNKSRRGKYV